MLLEEDRDHLVDQSLNLVVTGILAILERELESAILRGRLAPYAFLSRRERRKTHASEFQSKRNVHNLVMCNAKELHSQRIASSKRHRWLDQPRTASHPNFKPTRTSPVPS